MSILINFNRRRFSGKAKNWCRRNPEQIKYTHRPVYTSSYIRSNNQRKIFFRSFRSKRICIEFLNNLNFRYKRRYKHSINFRINLRGNKLEYFGGGKCKV